MKPDLNIREVVEFPVEKVPLYFDDDLIGTSTRGITGDRGVAIVRMDKMEIIARMSSQYQLVMHSDVLDAVESVFNANGVKHEISNVMTHGTRNSSMLVRYVLPDIHTGFAFGDEKFFPMINVNNSYDGITRFYIRYGIWRKVCSNGAYAMTDGGFFNKIHIHKSITLEGLFEHLDEWITVKFPAICRDIGKLVDVPPIPFPKFADILKPMELEQFIMDETIQYYYGSLGENRYAQLNAITEFAKSVNTERRNELELSVHKFLTADL